MEFSDQTVAILSENGIKGLKVGTTTITFKTEDGNKTATCAVTVTENTAGVVVTSNNYEVNQNKEIYNVPNDTTVGEFKENIDTDGTITQVKDKDNNTLSDDSQVGTGSIITVTSDTTTETYTVIVQGDINGDGDITEEDINKVEQHLSGQTQLTGVGAEAADIDGDGQITIKDLELMKQE